MPPLSPDSTNCSSGVSVESVELPCMIESHNHAEVISLRPILDEY